MRHAVLLWTKAVCNQIGIAAWAALFATSFWVSVFVLPNAPKARAAYEHARLQANEIEHDFYCRRWKLGPGTHEYATCMADLSVFRTGVEKSVLEDLQY
jgi:hypothetical protein